MDLLHTLRADIVAAALALERHTGMRANFTGTLGELDAAMHLGVTGACGRGKRRIT